MEESDVNVGQRLECCCHKSRDTWTHQKLEEAGRILP